MEKILVEREVGTLDVSYVSLQDVLEEVQTLIAEHGTEATVRLEQGAYSDHYSAYVYKTELETDEEFAARQRRVVEHEQREKAEFERLKAKFS
jgi:hypothetical protein